MLCVGIKRYCIDDTVEANLFRPPGREDHCSIGHQASSPVGDDDVMTSGSLLVREVDIGYPETVDIGGRNNDG